ncbi:MAG: hypothetical protein ACXIUD_08850 [Mongoliitalea sp.]
MKKLLLLTFLSLLLISCKNDGSKNHGLENSDPLDLTEVYPGDQYICDFINKMIENKFQLIYYDFEDTVYLHQSSFTGFEEQFGNQFRTLSDIVERQKSNTRLTEDDRFPVEKILSEEDFQIIRKQAKQSYSFKDFCLSDRINLQNKTISNFAEGNDDAKFRIVTFLNISKPAFTHDGRYAFIFLVYETGFGKMVSGSSWAALYENQNGEWNKCFSIELAMF